jgi:general secretion pathway protein D
MSYPPATPNRSRLIAAGAGLAAALLLCACASTSALRAGQRAERASDLDRAVIEYTKAVRQRPEDRGARLALERVKLRAAEEHVIRGRRLVQAGRVDEALVEFQVASELNPADTDIDAAVRDVRQRLRTKLAQVRDGKTDLQTLVERARTLPPPGLELPNVKLPVDSLVFSNASSRMILTSIARFADLNIVFDPAFRDASLSIDLRSMTLDGALEAVTASTHTFYRVTAPRTITIVPDTPQKRREYEESIVQTFYLSNAEMKEVIELLRVVVDIRQISQITAMNAISLRDTPERIAAAGKLIAAIDKARPEVVIDVELLEVDRSRMHDFGLQIASPGTGVGISGSADVNRDGLTLRNLRTLSQSSIFLADVPALYYRLLKSDANTRTLASPHIRTYDGLTAQARFGDQVPVPNVTFAPLATGGVNQQPITAFEYRNIGVNIDITPRMHHDDEVSLGVKLSVTSIGGAGYAGLPTFGNREISTTIRLHDGETNILAGLIRDDERTTLSGIPGLSDLPFVGRLFARNQKDTKQTDIILTLTPHIVRVLDISEADLRPFRIGRDTGGALGGDAQQIQMPPRGGGEQEPVLPLPTAPPKPDPAVKEPPPPAFPQAYQPRPGVGVPQPLQGTMPGTPINVTPPKKPGGGASLP